MLTNDQIVWTMITTFLATFYNSANVYMSNQNYYTVGIEDEFVIINKKSPKQHYTPNRYFDVTNQKKILWGYNDIQYQVDLYGIIADDAMNALYTILMSTAGSNFLMQYNAGIGEIKEPLNLTKSNDRDNYMSRYMILFTLLSNTKIELPATGISNTDIKINIKNYT